MSKAEEFIESYTRNCSNEIDQLGADIAAFSEYHPWLTPDQARRAVEIARGEMIAKAVDGVVTFDYYEGDKAYGCVAHDSFCLEDLGLKDRDEVKILILKK